jgi:NAD(P)-dependent dehydrogenase (short-subunit alcohol dehydrogenase family)
VAHPRGRQPLRRAHGAVVDGVGPRAGGAVFGEAEELSGAVIFLASPNASSFITGTDIRIDGGFLSQTI